MKDHIRIYYNMQCVYLTENANALIRKEEIANAWVVRNSKCSVDELFLKFIKTDFQVLILQYNVSKLVEAFKNRFVHIQAGGGLLKNEAGAYLFIERLGKWDLPKGKLNPDEDITTCAKREMAEETGVSSIELIEKLLDTYHIYQQNDEYILKETTWYTMSAPLQVLVPQAEEDITAASWLRADKIEKALENTYPNILWLWEVYTNRKPS